jgi:type III secretion protein J
MRSNNVQFNLTYITRLLMLSLFFLVGCGSSAIIVVNGSQEREANRIVVILENNNIRATKVQQEAAPGSSEVLYNVTVSSNDRTNAMRILDTKGLPAQKSPRILDLFKKEGLVQSETENKIRYHAGKEAELSSMIRNINGVIEANVQIAYSTEEPMPGRNQVKDIMTAAVYVQHQGVLDNPNLQYETKIKDMVSKSVSGLEAENVTVISDLSTETMETLSTVKEVVDFVSIAGIKVSKSSKTQLRVVMFSLVGLVLVFFVSSAWLFWKIHRLAVAFGGMKTIVGLNPYEPLKLLDHVRKEQKNDEETVSNDPNTQEALSEDKEKKPDENK